MGERVCVFSVCKVRKYVRKFFWVFVVLLLLGVLAFGLGISSNKKKTSNITKTFGYQTTLFFQPKENYMNNSYIGDFNVFITTDQFMDRVRGDKIGISLETMRHSDSNCFSIIVKASEKDIAKQVARNIVQEGKKIFAEVHPNIRIEEVGGNFLENEGEISVQLVQFKDLVLLFLPIVIGFLYVYILMILDDTIYTGKELEKSFEFPVYIYSQSACLEQIRETEGYAIIIGRNLEITLEGITDVIELDTFLTRKIGMDIPKMLVLKVGSSKYREIDEFMKILNKFDKKEFKICVIE